MRPNNNMERCRQCNSTLAPEEQICWACNAQVPEKNPKKTLASRFTLVVNVLFVILTVLTLLALVVPEGYVPPFKRTAAVLVVVFLVRSSLHTMADATKR